MEFFEFANHSIWSKEGWDLDIEFPLKGNSGDWQPHYQRLKYEDSITVTSARVDLACLLVGCSLPSVLHMGPLEGKRPFQMEDSSSAFKGEFLWCQ